MKKIKKRWRLKISELDMPKFWRALKEQKEQKNEKRKCFESFCLEFQS